jgi:predicted CxxxxCH...CXXCH cytochrome family protein
MMKSHCRRGYRRFLTLVVASGLVIFSAALALAGSQYDLRCVDCHTMPPQDSANGGRLPVSGAVKGNHEVHADAGTASCVKCHGAEVLSYGPGHRDKVIRLQENINASAKQATYSRGVFFNQTSVPPAPLGSCSNVNCHFESVTPAWGSPKLSRVADASCGACHSAAPSTLAHGAHLARYGSDLNVCAKCHPDHRGAQPFAHATSAGIAGKKISVTAGSYAGSNSSFLPSQAASRVLGSCSTTYCHSPGQGPAGAPLTASDYATVNWGNPSGGACGSCHAASKAALASGSHAKHLNAVGSNGCGDCHAGATGNGASYDDPRHIDSMIDVSGTYSKGASHAPGSGYGNCSAASCHDNGTGVTVATPQWGTAAPACSVCHAVQPVSGSHTAHLTIARATCGDCHNGAVKGASPSADHLNGSIEVYSQSPGDLGYTSPKPKGSAYDSCSTASCHDDGTGNPKESPVWGTIVADCSQCHDRSPATGSHQAHLTSANITCASCHKGSVEGGTAPDQHLDGNVDVYKTTPGDLGYLYNGQTTDKPKGSAPASCATASCHRNASLQQIASGAWGTASAQRCGACHASRPATGSHTAHFDAGFATCSSCHKGALEGVSASELHVNGAVDVYQSTPGDFGYPQAKAYGSATATCSAGSCHDDGRGNFVTSPKWGTTVANCTACHATRPATGSHSSHMNAGLTCGGCHKGTVEGSVAPTEHMDNNVDAYVVNPGDLGYPANKVKGSSYTSCTTSSCHGTLSKAWGISTSNHQCTKCHGKGTVFANYSSADNRQAAPGYGGSGVGTGQQTGVVTGNVSSDPKVGAHDTHLRALNNLGKPALCNDCHKVPAVAFVSGHMNGSTEMVWSNLASNKETVPGSQIPYTYSTGQLAPAYSNGQCSNLYCHGATLPGGTNKNPSWTDGNYLTGTASDCDNCHGAPPTTSTKFPHTAQHTDCTQCHPHNGSRESTDPLLGRDFHMNGKVEANNFCDTCHDYDTRGTNGSIWGKNAIAVEGFGAHAVHINYLKQRMGVTTLDPNADAFGTGATAAVCGTCHSNIAANHSQNDWSASRQLYFGESTARQFGANSDYRTWYNGVSGISSASRPKTCSNIDCHYKTSPIWSPY